MLSERIDNNTWLLIAKETYPIRALVVSKFPALDKTQIVISRMQTGDGDSRFLEIAEELYSSFIWALDSDKLLRDVVEVFKTCYDPESPVELVYEFGGTLNGRDIVIAKFPGAH